MNAMFVDTSTKVDGLKLWNQFRMGNHMQVIEDLAKIESAIL